VRAPASPRGDLLQRFALGLLALASLGLQLSFGETGLLFLGPFLVLFAALVMGLYPGEKLLERLVAGRSRPGRRRRRTAPSLRSRPRLVPRGGALLAASLAGRAPPL
jgi:hypothetical protein